MIQPPPLIAQNPELHSFAKLMRKLGETFAVRDVMIPLSHIEYVAPGDMDAANLIVAEKRYSVVPASEDGEAFETVFCTEHPLNSDRIITEMRTTSVSDHIPDSTPLAEAFYLFDAREWYFTLRRNQVSGLVTYWIFNSREFRVQLYAGLSRVEELSRDVLAQDGCGVTNDNGLNLSSDVLDKLRKRFEAARKDLGGNRFVDELDFHHVNDALKKHSLWRDFLNKTLGTTLSNTQYERLYTFTDLRDAVMHGRVLFPTYHEFRQGSSAIKRIGDLIEYLDAYRVPGQ
jgi:hypothetical protein